MAKTDIQTSFICIIGRISKGIVGFLHLLMMPVSIFLCNKLERIVYVEVKKVIEIRLVISICRFPNRTLSLVLLKSVITLADEFYLSALLINLIIDLAKDTSEFVKQNVNFFSDIASSTSDGCQLKYPITETLKVLDR